MQQCATWSFGVFNFVVASMFADSQFGSAPSIIGFNFGSEISFWPESSNGIKCQGSQVYLLG